MRDQLMNDGYLLGDHRLDLEKRILWRKGERIHLSRRPFDVLLYLIENRERLISRAELLDRFWEGKDVYEDALSKAVGAIRKALGDNMGSPRFIETRWAGGYRYIGPFEEQREKIEAPITEIERTRGVRIVVEEEEFANHGDMTPPAAPAPMTAAMHRPAVSRQIFLAATGALATVAVAAAFIVNLDRAKPPANAPATTNSVAVLPLKNITGDARDDYLSDGITEALITELSKASDLKVMSRASVFALKDQNLGAYEAGQRLGVANIIEGGLLKSGDRIRVQLRLVNAGDGRVIWASDSVERPMTDIFALQDQISCEVAAHLKAVLCGKQHGGETQNLAAYEAYLKARYYWNQRTAEGLTKAIQYFQQAAEIDPNYALAYCGLAQSYKLAVWYVPMPASEAVPQIEKAAARAIELDDALPEAHMARGEVYSFQWQWDKTIAELERATALNPNYADAHHNLGLGLALQARFDRAFYHIERARELDPLSLVINTDIGWIYYLAHRYDEAVAQYQKTLELDPNFSLAHFDLALTYSVQGRHDQAIAEMQKARGRGSDYLAGLGYVYAVAGRRAEAFGVLADLERLARQRYVPPYHFAWIYTGLGDKDKAISLLQKVYDEHTQHVVDFKTVPMFDSLRTDERFQELVRRVGLPD